MNTIHCTPPAQFGSRVNRLALAAVLLCTLSASPLSRAANRTWIGAGTDAAWLTTANWDARVVGNDLLFFDGITQTSNTNNFNTDFTFNGITFNAGAAPFTLGGISYNLNGSITNNSTVLQTINNSMFMNATRTIALTAGGGNVRLGGNYDHGNGSSFGFTLAGTGTLILGGSNLLFGPVTIAAGQTLNLSHSAALEFGILTMNGGNVVFDSSVGSHAFVLGNLTGTANLGLQDNAGSPNPVALTVGHRYQDSTYSGVLSGPGSVAKAGAFTLTLNPSTPHTFGGALAINFGTLLLDFTNMAAATDLLPNGRALGLGGTLSVRGKNTGNSSQTLGNLTINAGTAAGIVVNSNSGAGTTLTLGNAWTRGVGSTLNVDISGGGILASAPTTLAGNNNVLGFATVRDGTNVPAVGLAQLSGGNIVRLAGQSALANNSDSATTDFITSGNLTMNTASFSANSLTLDGSTVAGALDLGGAGDVLTLASKGLVMIGTNNVTISNGQVGAADSEMIVHQMGTGILTNAGTFGGGTGSLVKDGPGTLVLSGSGANAYSGLTRVNGGTLVLAKTGVNAVSGDIVASSTTGSIVQLAANNQIPDSAVVTLDGGAKLQLNGRNETIGGLQTISPNTASLIENALAATTGTLTISNTANYVFEGIVRNGAGAGSLLAVVKNGSGTLTLRNTGRVGNNDFGGGLTISNGAVVVSDNGNGGTFSMGGSVTNFGTFVLENTSGGFIGQNYARTIFGTGNLVTIGPGNVVFTTGGSGFTGNVTVSNVMTRVNTGGNNNGLLSAFGNPTAAGRSISVMPGSTLMFAVNNVFGNATAGYGASIVPITLNGATLLSSRYNVLGDIILTNGATLTQRVTDGPGTFEGFQFRGNIFVGGNAASIISASTPDSATTTLRANHLGPNTTFTVADVTGNANVDLTVTAVLRDQSGDFAVGPGALTKAGAGTMLLNAANTYSGGTTVSAGTLRLGDDAALGAATGSLTLNGGTLDLNGHSVSISAFNGSGGAVLASSAAATLNIDHSTLSTFSGSINDGGATLSVTKNGSGIQNLNGANGYTGPTALNAGTLNLSTSKSGTGGISANDGTFLGINVVGSSVMTLSALALGAGSGSTIELSGISSTTLAPINSGTLTLNGTITVNIVSGSFVTGQSYPLIKFSAISGTGNFVLGSTPGLGATLATNVDTIVLNVSFAPQVWTGAADNNWDLATGGNWSFGGVASVYTDGALATFDDGAIRPNVNLNATVSPAGIVMQNNAKSYSFSSTSGNVIAGTGSLLKNGVGSLTISNVPNTYSGPTTIKGGVINVATLANGGSASDIGAAASDAGNLVLNGGTLRYVGAGSSMDRLFGLGLLGGALDASGTGILKFINSGSMDFNGQSGARTLTLTGVNTGDNTLAATIADNGDVTRVTKTGTGTWNLSGANSYGGPTTVSAGVLRLGNASALGTATSTATVSPGATIDLNGQTVSSLLAFSGGAGVGGNGVLVNNSATPAEVTTAINNPGIITVGGTGTTTLDRVFGPSGISITKTSTGTLILGGDVDNSFLTVDVRQGILLLNKASNPNIHALGGDPNCLLVNGGTARLTGSGGDQIANTRGIVVNSGIFDLNGLDEAINNLSSTAAGGVITNSAGTPCTFTIGANNTAGTYSGSIRDNPGGGIALVKIGTATQIISGTNTYGGGTAVSAGVLQYGNTNAIPFGPGKGNLTVDGILDLAGYSPAVNGLNGGGNVTNSALTNVTLTLGLNNQSGIFSGAIRQGATNVAVTKVGTGAAALSGANTYRGVTTVSAGKLSLSTLHQGTNTITVSDNAALGVIVSGTNVMQPYSLILGSSTGATNEYVNLSRTDVTPVNVSNLTVTGTIRISIASVAAPGVYPLIHYTNINGVGSFVLGSLPVGVSASSVTTNNNTIFVTVTAVTPYIWSGGSDNNWDLASSGNWTFNSSPVIYVDNSIALFDDTAAGSTSVNLNATVSPARINLNNNSKNYTFSSASGYSITGAGSLAKNGTGTLLLSGLSNSFSGGLIINAGTVATDGNDNLGAIATPITLNGGALGAAASFTLTNRTVTGNGALDVTDGQTLTFLGLISGSTNITKTGAGTLELTGPRATWVGNFVVNAGSVLATNQQNDPGTATALGDNSVAGRIHTVNTNGILRFLVNNMFGNQNNVGTLPTVVVNGGTLDSTRYNQLGNVTLRNGGTLTQSATDSGNYEGYQFLGNITVSGGLPSMIASGNGKADHLGTGTIFDVADVSGNGNADLIVSAPLRNVSGDYALAPGTLIKSGAGTLLLSAANVYNGPTTVSNGTLIISTLHAGNGSFAVRDGASLGFTNAQNGGSAAISSLAVGTLGGTALEFQDVSDIGNPLALVAGNLNVSGACTMRITGTNGLVPGSVYPLVKYGALTGGGGLSLALPPGVSATLTNDLANSWLALNFTGFSSVNTNPTNIIFSVSGANLSLSWPSDHLGWTLQTNAVSVADPNAWFPVPGSSSLTSINITIDASKPNMFFRLVYP